MFDVINALLNVQSLEDLRAQIEANADVLFSQAADQFLELEIAQQTDHKVIQALEFVRDLLRACRQVGIKEAFRHLQPPDAGTGQSAPPRGLDAQTQAIAEAIIAFVNTPDWDATRVQIEKHQSVLFTDVADRVFGDFIAAVDDPKIREMLEAHRTLLQVCRQMGIAAAFSRLQ